VVRRQKPVTPRCFNPLFVEAAILSGAYKYFIEGGKLSFNPLFVEAAILRSLSALLPP